MKNVLLLLLLLGSATALFAQKKPKPEGTGTIIAGMTAADPYDIAGYRLAMRYGDLQVAVNYVYEIIVAEGAASTWRDTLLQLYAFRGAHMQSLLLADELLKDRPEDLILLEVRGGALNALGDTKEALAAYEKLYGISKNISHLYQIAALQYSLARLGECTQSITNIIQHPEAEKQTVSLSFNNQTQKVPAKAAAINIQGIMLKDLGKTEEAKQAFSAALKVFPDFVLAKNNLAALEGKK